MSADDYMIDLQSIDSILEDRDGVIIIKTELARSMTSVFTNEKIGQTTHFAMFR